MKLAFLFLFLGLTARAQSLTTLANSQEWLQLLHMKKTWSGHYKSTVQGRKFFLSTQGAANPEAELQETVRQMFEADAATEQKAQCQFLARRDFLFRQGKPEWKSQEKPCQLTEGWLGKLHATKISLIFAAGYMNSAASSFGHTFLKLKNPENEGKELLDYGVNYAARTRDTKGALYALYGLFGYFPGTFALLPYHQMIKEYTHLEGRDLWEYELDFTPEEVRRVLYHLLELENGYFDYYFLDDNCSFELLKVLELGRPGLKLADDDEFFVIPVDTLKLAQPLVRKLHFRPSMETEWRQRRNKLNPQQRDSLLALQEDPEPKSLQTLDSEALSAAQYLFALKELENHDLWKSFGYEISREQARRGTQRSYFQIQTPADSPEQGPHSSAVEVGFLDQQKSYLLSGLRLAFHDQLSRNVGVSPFSHLEVLGFQWQTSQGNQTLLRRYRLLETLSTKSIDGFEKPLSWGVSIGADAEIESPTRLRHQLSGRFGYSFDLFPERLRWTALLVGGIGQDLNHDFQFVPGADSRIWFLWTPKIRSFAQYEYMRFPSSDFDRLSGFQVFDLTQQLELRFGWQMQRDANQIQQVEKSVSLVQNFLL